MAILVIACLLFFIIILAVICIQRSAQIISLKRQVEFLEYSLEQLTEKEEASGQELNEDTSVEDLIKLDKIG